MLFLVLNIDLGNYSRLKKPPLVTGCRGSRVRSERPTPRDDLWTAMSGPRYCSMDRQIPDIRQGSDHVTLPFNACVNTYRIVLRLKSG